MLACETPSQKKETFFWDTRYFKGVKSKFEAKTSKVVFYG